MTSSAIADARDKLIEEALANVAAAGLRGAWRCQGALQARCRTEAIGRRSGTAATCRSGFATAGGRAQRRRARPRARLGSADGDRSPVHSTSRPTTTCKDAIADLLAAKATLDKRGVGHGASGEEARRGMETRARVAGERANEIAEKLVDEPQVLLGGGTARDAEPRLVARLEAASETARKRLFPQFKDADRPRPNGKRR